MYFGTFIDMNGDWLDTVHFPDVNLNYPLSGKGFYSMKGKVVEEFGVYSLEVKYCRKAGIKLKGKREKEEGRRDKEERRRDKEER